MSSNEETDFNELHLRLITDKLESGALKQARKMLNNLHPAEIANLLESLRPSNRAVVWELVDSEMAGEILVEVNEEVRAGLIEATEDHDLINAAGTLETDDLADILHDLPDVVLHQVLRSMSNQDRKRLEAVMSYDEDSAGGLMNTDMITVRPEVSIDVVQRYLRQHDEIPDHTDQLIVVNRSDRYLGTLPLTTILTNDKELPVSDVMSTQGEAMLPTLSAKDVASRFENHNLVSAPVVDESGFLLGRITIDDVVDVIREEADHTILSRAGLDEDDDMFAPVARSAKRRAFWLGINLFTAFLAAWVIGLFEATIQEIVALAVLMPIVASMGGIAGSQTLTLVIRGIALNQIGKTNARWLMWKELAVGALNGVLWASVVAVVAGVWFQSVAIGSLIGVAMTINLVVAALAGATIPLMLVRMKIDPALAGGVVLTTVTDVIGFFAFLGLATIFLI